MASSEKKTNACMGRCSTAFSRLSQCGSSLMLNAATSCSNNHHYSNNKHNHSAELFYSRKLHRSAKQYRNQRCMTPMTSTMQTTRTMVVNTADTTDECTTLWHHKRTAARLRTNIASIRQRRHSIDSGEGVAVRNLHAVRDQIDTCRATVSRNLSYLQSKLSPSQQPPVSWTSNYTSRVAAAATKLQSVNQLLCESRDCLASIGYEDSHSSSVSLRRTLSFPDLQQLHHDVSVTNSSDIVLTCCPCLCYGGPLSNLSNIADSKSQEQPSFVACSTSEGPAECAKSTLPPTISAEIISNDIRMVNSSEFLICENIILHRSMPLTVCELRAMIGDIPMCKFCKANLKDIASAIHAHKSICNECNSISLKPHPKSKPILKKAGACGSAPPYESHSCQVSMPTASSVSLNHAPRSSAPCHSSGIQTILTSPPTSHLGMCTCYCWSDEHENPQKPQQPHKTSQVSQLRWSQCNVTEEDQTQSNKGPSEDRGGQRDSCSLSESQNEIIMQNLNITKDTSRKLVYVKSSHIKTVIRLEPQKAKDMENNERKSTDKNEKRTSEKNEKKIPVSKVTIKPTSKKKKKTKTKVQKPAKPPKKGKGRKRVVKKGTKGRIESPQNKSKKKSKKKLQKKKNSDITIH